MQPKPMALHKLLFSNYETKQETNLWFAKIERNSAYKNIFWT